VRLLALHGSPRKGGNTELLLQEALRGAQEEGAQVELLLLNELDIRGCQDCGGCTETGQCVIQDDMELIYPLIRSCHRILLTSPIFFLGVSAQLKAVVDRCQAFWCEKYLLKRPIPQPPEGRRGLFITVGGMHWAEGLKCSEATVRAFFRSISVPEHHCLGYLGVDALGAIRQHPTALKEAYEAGKKLVKGGKG
jgi:multimeric flavodoxin WrbA